MERGRDGETKGWRDKGMERQRDEGRRLSAKGPIFRMKCHVDQHTQNLIISCI